MAKAPWISGRVVLPMKSPACSASIKTANSVMTSILMGVPVVPEFENQTLTELARTPMNAAYACLNDGIGNPHTLASTIISTPIVCTV